MRDPKMLSVFIFTLFLSACAYAERGGGGGGGSDFHSSGSSGGGEGHSFSGGGGRAGGGFSNGGSRSFGNRSFNGWGRANNYQRFNGYFGNGRGYRNPNGGWGGRGNAYYRSNGAAYGLNYSKRGWNGAPTQSNYNRAQVPSRLRSMGVRSLPPSNRGGLTPTGSPHNAKVAAPRTGPTGAAFHGSVLGRGQMNSAGVRGQMRNIAGNAAFTRNANMLNSTETRAGRYNWHNWNGTNFCHYCDGYGCNWYGWNCGGGLFWSCWYGGNWWWYDPFYSRWDYWYDDAWWWQNPYNANLVYGYDGDGYVPAGDVQSGAAPLGELAYNGNVSSGPPPAGGVFDSPDGKNEVRVTGSGDAFLYDMVKSGPKPVYLDSNVKEVKYSKPGKGKTGQVVVILNDGTFEMFDTKGKPIS